MKYLLKPIDVPEPVPPVINERTDKPANETFLKWKVPCGQRNQGLVAKDVKPYTG